MIAALHAMGASSDPHRMPLHPSSSAPLVSVCVPTYNGARYLREALESVVAQTYGNLEIVTGDAKGESQSGPTERTRAGSTRRQLSTRGVPPPLSHTVGQVGPVVQRNGLDSPVLSMSCRCLWHNFRIIT